MMVMSPNVSDKLMHFSGFFGLATLLCWVIPTRTSVVRKFAWVAAISLCYAAFDELSQGFVRGRTTDIRDFAADAAGTFSAIAVYAAVRSLFPRLSKFPPDSEEIGNDPVAHRPSDKPYDTDQDQLRHRDRGEAKAKSA